MGYLRHRLGQTQSSHRVDKSEVGKYLLGVEFCGIGRNLLICQKRLVRILSLLLIPLLTSGLLQAAGGGKGNVTTPSPEPDQEMINKPLSQAALKGTPKSIFQRVIQARLFHSGIWTLTGTSQTPVTVARTLASLQPTFLAGILRLPDHGEISEAEVEGFSVVRKAVLATSKNCRFDVLINAGIDHSSEVFVARMKEFSARLHPDSWTFYVPPETRSISPEIFEHGIAQAHAEGQMVGYDGPLSLIPEGVDFIILRAWDFRINRQQLDLLRAKQRIPLIVELPTTFGTKDYPEVVSYVGEMDTKDRVTLITELAENQSSWGYRFSYPIFYPLYPARHAFDATKDNILLVSIRALIAKFN